MDHENIKSITLHKKDGSEEQLYIITKHQIETHLQQIIATGEKHMVIILVEE